MLSSDVMFSVSLHVMCCALLPIIQTSGMLFRQIDLCRN